MALLYDQHVRGKVVPVGTRMQKASGYLPECHQRRIDTAGHFLEQGGHLGREAQQLLAYDGKTAERGIAFFGPPKSALVIIVLR